MITSIETLYQIFLQFPSVTTDTRSIKKDDIFFALKGPNFNGNNYAATAIANGASFAVVDDESLASSPKMLLVADVLQALQQLALHHRKQFNIPVIAITGSNGKTTTKELVAAVLGQHLITHTTQGNLNNHIGVPLTLLQLKKETQIAVIEMGANHQKEIAGYCEYTLPTHGLITNCGKAHLEGFGGVEGIRKGKGELFDFLREHHGIVFACTDFDYFQHMTQGLENVHWYGTNDGEIVGKVIKSEPLLEVNVVKGMPLPTTIPTQLVGGYNIYNVLAAAALGLHFGVPVQAIVSAIAHYHPTNSRSQLLTKNGNQIILDAYNANPTSMTAAIENFAGLHAANKILFIGGMMELGEDSQKEHQQIISLIQQYSWKEVILVGGDFAKTSHPFRYFENAIIAAQWWKTQSTSGNYLLIKGSRSMKMETILTEGMAE